MKTLITFCLMILVASITLCNHAQAQSKGPLTPTSVTYTFNSAQLTTFDDDNYSLFLTPLQYTFRKSDPDFANAQITDVTITYGRYKSISLCFNTSVSMTVDGSIYKGQSGTLIDQDDVVYGQANGTIGTTNPGSVQTLTTSISTEAQNCTATYFRVPLCVTASGTTGCETGDDIYTVEGKINPTTGQLDLGSGAAVKLQISFLMDMLNSVIINADSGAVTTAPAVKVTLGKPGAAIHLGKWDTNGATDLSLIFSNDKTLLSAISSEYPGTHSAGYCDGGSTAAVTAVPSDSPLPTGVINITHVNASTGAVAYPSTASCMNASACTPVGFNILTNVLQQVSSTTNVNCVGSSDSSVPQYLKDFTYVGTPGTGEAGTIALEIKRIVDPTNLFGICTSSSTGYITGKTGVCAFAGSDANGY